MDRTTAMQSYIDKVVRLEFTKEMSNDNNDDIDYDEDTYDNNDDDAVMNVSGVGNRPSTLMFDDDYGDDEDPTIDDDHTDDPITPSNKRYTSSYPLHAAAQAGQLETLKTILKLSL